MLWLDSLFQDLARQMAFTPVHKRREQLQNARRLFAGIDPDEDYTWEYLRYRITEYRPREEAEHRISGKAVFADLACLMESVSDTLDIYVNEATEEILSLEQVVRRFMTSEKTIQRWRRQGLLALHYIYPDGVRRLGFPAGDIDRFERTRPSRRKASARRRELKPNRYGVQSRLADPEANSLAKARADVDAAGASAVDDPLTGPNERIIADCFARGVSTEFLARRYGHSPADIQRTVLRQKALRLKNLPIHFVTNPLFDLPDAERTILEVLPAEADWTAASETAGVTDLWQRVPKAVPAAVADAFRQPPMPHPLVIDAFRRMNYFKAQASRLQAQLDVDAAGPDELARIETLLARAAELRNQLLQSHLRIVVHVARRHLRAGEDLLELISDGNLWLMRAVGSYDFARGVKFSTYLTYSLMKNFAHRFSARQRHSDERLILAQDTLLDQLDVAADDAQLDVPDAVDRLMLQGRLADALTLLPARQREVLAAHYGLQAGQGPLSLARLAESMGVTKTRVRQIETRALHRLRHILRVTPPPAQAPDLAPETACAESKMS